MKYNDIRAIYSIPSMVTDEEIENIIRETSVFSPVGLRAMLSIRSALQPWVIAIIEGRLEDIESRM